MMANKRRVNLFAVVFLFLAGAVAQAGMIVVPSGPRSGGGYFFPFDLAGPIIPGGIRYQQAYSALQFSAFGGAEWITQILFRTASTPNARAFSSTLTDIRIDLSTILTAPDSLSTVLDANVGSDDTVVYGPGSLALSSQNTGAFDIVVAFTTPFLYDPARGNLLLDVRAPDGSNTTLFDGQPVSSIGSAFNIDAGGINGDKPIVASGPGGLVTEFVFTAAAIPEPPPVALIGGAVLLMVVCGLGRGKRLSNGFQSPGAPSV